MFHSDTPPPVAKTRLACFRLLTSRWYAFQVDNEFAARFLFALANVPGNVASLLLIESLGRRRLLWGSMLIAAFFAFVFAACASPDQPRLVPRKVSLRETLYSERT